jgi:hypothetical protein
MLLPGVYEKALITGSNLQKGKSDDDPVVMVYFMADGETITAWLYTTLAAWPYTQKKLAACGFDPAENDFNLAALDLEGDANPIANQHVRIVVKEEEFEGKIRSKVAWIGPGDGMVERMAPEEAVSFTKALRRRLMASQGAPKKSAPPKKTSPKSAPAAPAQATGTADDNPW